MFLQANSTFEDLKEGYRKGVNKINFKKALVICNTKISEHAKRYAEYRGIKHIGWKYPIDAVLENMIEKNRLYPITILKDLDSKSKIKFGDAGIVMLKQLVKLDVDLLYKKTGIAKNRLEDIVAKAKKIQ